MNTMLMKAGIRTVPYLLWAAPKLSTALIAALVKNPKLQKFTSRPELVRRAGKSIATGGILISQLNVTNACNERCPMCNLWPEASKMPLERVKLAIDRIAELGSFILTITGGEPFGHPQIAEIIDYAHAKQFFLNINTNASIGLRRYQAVDLNKIDLAIISMHAMDEEKLRRVTGVPRTLPKVLEVLRHFRDNTTVRVILKYVIQKENDGEMETVQAFADAEGFTVEYHPVMVASAHKPVSTSNQDLLLDDERLLDTLLKIQQRKASDRTFESSIYYQFCIDAIKRGSLKWNCDAGRNYLSVYPDGRFGICKDVYTSANIFDDDFLEKFRSPEFQAEMKSLREACEGCNWSCYITASQMARITRNPLPEDLALLKSY